MTRRDDMTREDFIAGLRKAADFFEQHPDLPIPNYMPECNAYVETKKELKPFLRVGHWDKKEAGSTMYYRTVIGGVLQMDVNIDRQQVCERVVTGVRTIPAQPERVEEEVEWICKPVFGGENE